MISKPIEGIEIGDKVLAADPQTGETTERKVLVLFDNDDVDLTDVTLETPSGDSATVHTTDHHPFWSETRHEWVDAAALAPGESLRAQDGSVVTVRHVKNFTLHRVMHDLTIADIHTYYVLASTTPVLVHNCPAAAKALNAAEEATLGRMNDELFSSEGLRGVNAPDADFVGQSGKLMRWVLRGRSRTGRDNEETSWLKFCGTLTSQTLESST